MCAEHCLSGPCAGASPSRKKPPWPSPSREPVALKKEHRAAPQSKTQRRHAGLTGKCRPSALVQMAGASNKRSGGQGVHRRFGECSNNPANGRRAGLTDHTPSSGRSWCARSARKSAARSKACAAPASGKRLKCSTRLGSDRLATRSRKGAAETGSSPAPAMAGMLSTGTGTIGRVDGNCPPSSRRAIWSATAVREAGCGNVAGCVMAGRGRGDSRPSLGR